MIDQTELARIRFCGKYEITEFKTSRLYQSLAEAHIPEYMHDGVIRYIVNHIAPGDFLEAVISNDLREAVARADSENREALVHWVIWFYNHAPSACWGSTKRLKQWLYPIPKTLL